MATLNVTITNQVQEHQINYTGVRVRFQRSTTGTGGPWTDVQSNVRAIGTQADTYLVPSGANGHYRVGCTLTDGTVFATEIFSAPIQIAVFNVLTPITVAIVV
jgi:hypothetical protein